MEEVRSWDTYVCHSIISIQLLFYHELSLKQVVPSNQTYTYMSVQYLIVQPCVY